MMVCAWSLGTYRTREDDYSVNGPRRLGLEQLVENIAADMTDTNDANVLEARHGTRNTR